MPFFVKKLTPVKGSTLPELLQSVIELSKYTEDEFHEVARNLQGTEAVHIWNSVPPRPRRGTTAYADGTHWNPGSGEGPYFYNGSLWLPMSTKGVGVVSVKKQVFGVSGTYTPSTGMVFANVRLVGGGGGGGGVLGTANNVLGAGGGGSGAYGEALLTAASIGVSQVVTIGAGGSGGAAGANNGSPGGTTSLGSLVTANGGSGGGGTSSASYGSGGQGGTIGTADIAVQGQYGGQGLYLLNTAVGISVVPFGGAGGNSMIGTGGRAGAAGPGGNGISWGGGGGGGSNNVAGNFGGGAGAAGGVHVLEFCSQ